MSGYEKIFQLTHLISKYRSTRYLNHMPCHSFFSSKSNFKYDWHMSRGEMAKILHAICYGYVTRLEGTKNVSCLNLMTGTSYGKKI